jgi:hypothetical protein
MDPYLVQLVILYDTEFLCLELNVNIEIKYIKIYVKYTKHVLKTYIIQVY